MTFLHLTDVLIVGLGGDNATNQVSFVELSGRRTQCPKMAKYPTKLINAAAVVFRDQPVICGGTWFRSQA